MWLKNGGRGAAFTTHTISSDTPTAVSASAADVNGDTWPDVLVSTSSGTSVTASLFRQSVNFAADSCCPCIDVYTGALLFLGSSSGAFTESQTPLGGYCPNTLFAGLTSLDGDQYPDSIVSCTGNDTVLILHNRLSSPSPSPSASSSLSPSTTASETPAPSPSPAPYPQYFQWHVTPWSNCSCDANGDSWRTRDRCVAYRTLSHTHRRMLIECYYWYALICHV